MPAWAQNPPQIHSTNRFYLSAFWDLATERRYPQGPIPWSSIRQYAQQYGLADDTLRIFEVVVRELDEEFREFAK